VVAACGPQDDAVAALAVGDCFDEPPSATELDTVPLLACDEPHRYEVIGAVLLPDDLVPGDDLEAAAIEACAEPFERYVGAAPEGSTLRRAALVPTVSGWEDEDLEALCLVTDPEGSLVGSVAGSGR
jgi:hypothetical protein